MAGIIVDIDTSDSWKLKRTANLLKKYLGNDYEVSLKKQDKNVVVKGGTIEDVKCAWSRISSQWQKNHSSSPPDVSIYFSSLSERDEIEMDVRKEYQSTIDILNEKMRKLETKFSKDRSKFQDDIQKMRSREKETSKKIEYLEQDIENIETVLESSQMDFIEESIEKQDLEIALQIRDTEIEKIRQEHENYVKTPLYKLAYQKMKDFFSKS